MKLTIGGVEIPIVKLDYQGGLQIKHVRLDGDRAPTGHVLGTYSGQADVVLDVEAVAAWDLAQGDSVAMLTVTLETGHSASIEIPAHSTQQTLKRLTERAIEAVFSETVANVDGEISKLIIGQTKR